ncbi:hypothetical protein HMPREF1870_00167 [Bacteroidales bacterium KA00344]|nr:hypothetical protein HMPREF1870_00167 [Bacteroidales bacterium KA00344]
MDTSVYVAQKIEKVQAMVTLVERLQYLFRNDKQAKAFSNTVYRMLWSYK